MRIGISSTIALFCAFAISSVAHAQANSTDTRAVQLSAFGGLTGNWTELAGGRNISLTVGGNLGLRTFRGFLPTLEIRATEPISDGTVDAQKDVLGGIKLERHIARVHPYIDMEFGRGEVTYQGKGYFYANYPSGPTLFAKSPSNLYAFGLGGDIEITPSLMLKLDAQIVHYYVPVTDEASLYSRRFLVAAVYRFGYRQTRPH